MCEPGGVGVEQFAGDGLRIHAGQPRALDVSRQAFPHTGRPETESARCPSRVDHPDMTSLRKMFSRRASSPEMHEAEDTQPISAPGHDAFGIAIGFGDRSKLPFLLATAPWAAKARKARKLPPCSRYGET